jgi:serine/threonine protein kinase
MCPEILRCPYKQKPTDNKDNYNIGYGTAVDVWAVGVLAFELIHGRSPFQVQNT